MASSMQSPKDIPNALIGINNETGRRREGGGGGRRRGREGALGMASDVTRKISCAKLVGCCCAERFASRARKQVRLEKRAGSKG
jgi:hypothetical protein